MRKYLTGVSTCFWCNLTGNRARFEKAQIGLGNQKVKTVSWLDILFKQGLQLQDDNPVTLLVTGPPGSGKTTLILEMCYRLATDSDLFSLYISTDANTEQVIGNAVSYGWQESETRILPFFGNRQPDIKAVAIWGADKIEKWDSLSNLVDTAAEALVSWFNKLPKKEIRKLARIINYSQIDGPIQSVCPDILVIDSLNILQKGEQGEAFQNFLKTARKSEKPPKLIVFILDSDSSDQGHMFWEYACDTVMQLDHHHETDYYTRTIEIIKARFQEHIWGKHQLKIYPKFDYPHKDNYDYNRILRRAHPYREEGGIYIFPSIHYYLSVCKRQAPTQSPHYAATLPDELNNILVSPRTGEKGFPEERCTAFLGTRGGHKSHLGYLHLLNRIITHEENALVISLRDDEEMTKQTMANIISQQFTHLSPKPKLDDLEKNNRLEILYYPPGYITPEEFIHRMLMSISRLKSTGQKVTVLFNSLDQLNARFPLCARQEIFVPGIIEILSAEKVSSIFIAVDEPGQPAEQYGLLSMADLILSFYPQKFSFDVYYKHLNEASRFENRSEHFIEKIKKIKGDSVDTVRHEIVLQVVRFAGGQRSGASGILELVDEHLLDQSLYNRPGLHFTPLSSKF